MSHIGEDGSCAAGKDDISHFAIRAGYLIDGRGGPIRKNRLVEVAHGQIVSVAAFEPRKAISEHFIDLGHCTLLPALMDAHVHLTFSGTLNADVRQRQLDQDEAAAQAAIISHCKHHLGNGVVAVRDAGDRGGTVLTTTKTQRMKIHVAATCWAWHTPGRYGGMIGRTPDGKTDLVEAVARSPQNPAHIKIINSGINSLKQYGRRTAPQFSHDQMARVCQWAHRNRLPVMVHANGEEAVRMSITAGCDSIEHGYFMGADNLRRLAETGIVWVPTAVPMAVLADGLIVAPQMAEVARRTLDHQLEQIHQAHRLGVRIALGTDAGSLGVDHGVAARHELSLLLDAGLPITAAVRCATLNPARLMRLERRGTLENGRRADLIAIQGGPERLPDNLASIEAICLAGQWHRP